MGVLLAIIGIIILCFIDTRLTERKNDKRAKLALAKKEKELEIARIMANQKNQEMKNKDKSADLHELTPEEITQINVDAMTDILKSMGCQPQLHEGDSIEVQFQGENFLLQINSIWVRVWDSGWFSISNNHPDLTLIKEAVNYSNIVFGPTILLVEPNDEDNLILHSRMDIMLYPYCPINVDYIRQIMNSFFNIKDELRKNIHMLKMKSKEQERKHRPVGFDLSDTEFKTDKVNE